MNTLKSDLAPLLNSANLRSRLMDDDELVVQVLEACLPDMNANVRDYLTAIESGDSKKAVYAIHAIKGASQNADLVLLAEQATRAEAALRSGDFDYGVKTKDELEALVMETIGAVRAFLNR